MCLRVVQGFLVAAGLAPAAGFLLLLVLLAPCLVLGALSAFFSCSRFLVAALGAAWLGLAPAAAAGLVAEAAGLAWGAACVLPLVILMDVSRFLVPCWGFCAPVVFLVLAVFATGLAAGLTCAAFLSCSRFLVAALGAAWLGLAPAVLAAGLVVAADLACQVATRQHRRSPKSADCSIGHAGVQQVCHASCMLLWLPGSDWNCSFSETRIVWMLQGGCSRLFKLELQRL
jgi:hypothetical protein